MPKSPTADDVLVADDSLVSDDVLTTEDVLAAGYLSPTDLSDLGLSRHHRQCLVAAGRLVRLRNGRYVFADTNPKVIEAGRYGGRLTCISLLAAIAVFVREPGDSLHLQFCRGTTRLPIRPTTVRAHWTDTAAERQLLSTGLVDALVHACRCQSPRDAVATLDNAWHRGVIDEEALTTIFARLPRRYGALRALLDPRSESGAETLMRLILRSFGCQIELQVEIAGVGRVDMVVDGWLIVECDSKAFHEGWDAQRADRRRDLAAAALGYTTVRPLAEDIFYHSDDVIESFRSILASARLQNSTRLPARGA